MLTASCLYPVFRFLGMSVPPEPRYVSVTIKSLVKNFLVEKDFILFDGPDGPWAVSRICTHLGCRLNFSEQENLLICPCHQSRFTVQGKRISGPAKDDLELYEAEKTGGDLQDNSIKSFIVTL